MAKRSAVGLDIGTRSVHVAEVSTARGGMTVSNFGGVDLPVDAVREGEVLDPNAVSDAVRKLVESTGIKNREVWLGVANQRVVVRQIDLPWMDEKELRASLRFQVQEFIPIPVEEAELDFHVLDDYRNDADARMLRLLLVAAHKDMVGIHIEAVTRAGLRPIGVDLNPFALLRSVATTDSTFDGGTEVLVDVGAGVTNIVVHDQGVPRFVRILVLGGGDITEAISSGIGVDYEEAEHRKRAGALGNGSSDDPVGRIIESRATQFVDEIRSSLDYYQAQMGSSRVARLVLTGGGSLLNGLRDRLASTLRVPVELGNPFGHLDVGKDVRLGAEELEQVGPVLATAIGLAQGGTE